MENRTRAIYWREEDQSFLPKLNFLFLENFFRMEMSIYLQKMKAGKILDYNEYSKRFHYQTQPDEKGIVHTKTKPEAKGYEMEYDTFRNIDVKIAEIFGKWAQYFGSYNSLYAYYRKGKGLVLNEGDLNEYVSLLFNSLKKLRDEKDDFLKEMHQESLPSNLKSPSDQVVYASKKVLDYIMKQNDFDDRWFGHLPQDTTIYLESLGYLVDENDVDTICDKHFSSWISPNPDSIAKYLDELKGIFVQKLFDQKYL